MSPRILFRILAIAEAITWAGLITAIILRSTGVTDALVSPAGGIHGFVFLSYGVVTILVWINQRWRLGVGITGLISTVIPFATVPFDIWVDRKGLLEGNWRLAPGRDEPKNFFEKAEALLLRHPVLSIVVIVLAVVAVFITLLWLGPPIPNKS